MSAVFVSASSQGLLNSAAPVTAVPFTFGLWFYMTTSGAAENLFTLGDTGTGNNYWEIFKSATEKVGMTVEAASGASETDMATTLTLNAWHFLVFRAISAANRRMSILYSNGATEHIQNTGSRTPTGVDALSLGYEKLNGDLFFMNGRIAEFWLTNADIQVDNAQLQDSLLRQLAYGGPFSVPYIVPSIVDYQSFRVGPASDRNQGAEVYPGRFGRQVWTNTGGATMGPHPPLPYWYVNPRQALRALVV